LSGKLGRAIVSWQTSHAYSLLVGNCDIDFIFCHGFPIMSPQFPKFEKVRLQKNEKTAKVKGPKRAFCA